MAETRLNVSTDSMQSNSRVFKLYLEVLRNSTDLQLCDSEFQTEAALMLKCSPSPTMLAPSTVL